MHALISLKALYAAACAASTEASRYYLGGVCVEISARQVLYVATDGHILFAHREAVEPGNCLVGAWIVPSETIRAVKGRKSPTDLAILDGQPGELELSLKLPDGSDLEFKAIDGTFPDWRRIIPSKTRQDGPVPLFDPDRLGKLWKAGRILGEQVVGLGYNGSAPALVTYATDNTLGVVMPAHNPIATAFTPAWMSLPVSAADALAAE